MYTPIDSNKSCFVACWDNNSWEKLRKQARSTLACNMYCNSLALFRRVGVGCFKPLLDRTAEDLTPNWGERGDYCICSSAAGKNWNPANAKDSAFCTWDAFFCNFPYSPTIILTQWLTRCAKLWTLAWFSKRCHSGLRRVNNCRT